nr:PCRF domain-containing protein [Acidobacteriota bacterium]
MLEKLAQIERNYEELTAQISSPEIMLDMSAYAKTMKQHRSLEEIVVKYREVKRMQEELADARELFDTADAEDMREMAQMEIAEIEEKLPPAEEELKVLLLQKDPN